MPLVISAPASGLGPLQILVKSEKEIGTLETSLLPGDYTVEFGLQREHPVVFLHDPWFGYFGRRDVLCLWTNAGRRELGLEGIDDRWSPRYRFAFVRYSP